MIKMIRWITNWEKEIQLINLFSLHDDINLFSLHDDINLFSLHDDINLFSLHDDKLIYLNVFV